MALTPEERSLRARAAVHVMHARNDPKEITRAATAGFKARFEREADPDGVLPPEERARRGDHLFKAHMAKLALASSKARRLRREGAA